MSNTYCVKVTWIRNDQPNEASCIGNDAYEIIEADDEESAFEEAFEDHETKYVSDLELHHPTCEIEEWCICGRESDQEPWENVADGFRSKDQAVVAAKNDFLEWVKGGYREFYIDWNSNQNPAELFAEAHRDGIRFTNSQGATTDV